MADYIPSDNNKDNSIPINEDKCLAQVFHKDQTGGTFSQCQNPKKYHKYCGKHRQDKYNCECEKQTIIEYSQLQFGGERWYELCLDCGGIKKWKETDGKREDYCWSKAHGSPVLVEVRPNESQLTCKKCGRRKVIIG